MDSISEQQIQSPGSFDAPQLKNTSLLQRYRNMFSVGFGLLVLCFFVFEAIYFISQEYRKRPDKETATIAVTTSPTESVSDNFTFTDVNSDAYSKSQWQSYEFSYPVDFKLTDGSLSDSWFYLDVDGDPSKMIRIFGISENWGDATVENVVERRNISYKHNFPGFHLEEQNRLPNEKYSLVYTWYLDGTPTYRTYEFIKKYGRDIRFLQINAPVSVWEANRGVFDDILNRIRY